MPLAGKRAVAVSPTGCCPVEGELPQWVLDFGCTSPLQAQTQLLTVRRLGPGFQKVLSGQVRAEMHPAMSTQPPPTHQSTGSRLRGPSSGDPAASALVGVSPIPVRLIGTP